MNRINKLFQKKKEDILNIYFTAGYPKVEDTVPVLESLQAAGVDMVEIGMPFSDPLADGPVIQESSKKALENGMSLKRLFSQLENVRETVDIPIVLMGYLNPIMQYGIPAFLKKCKEVGVDGLILPDLPLEEYEQEYKSLFSENGISNIFLVTPETSEERLKYIDDLSTGFIYAVSSSSTTGKEKDWNQQEKYFKRLEDRQLKNPILVGFGVKDRETFQFASKHSGGAIIGTAFIKAITHAKDLPQAVSAFIEGVKEG